MLFGASHGFKLLQNHNVVLSSYTVYPLSHIRNFHSIGVFLLSHVPNSIRHNGGIQCSGENRWFFFRSLLTIDLFLWILETKGKTGRPTPTPSLYYVCDKGKGEEINARGSLNILKSHI